MKRLLAIGCCAVLFGCSDANQPSRTDVTANKPPVEADNSGVNSRDRDKTTMTPIDQNENKNDIRITADIRKRIVGEKLSVDAENVKIMTRDGKVTLRGPVKSADEKQRIESIATEVAGAGNVDSQLEVVTNQ